jgi:hypothetical protein
MGYKIPALTLTYPDILAPSAAQLSKNRRQRGFSDPPQGTKALPGGVRKEPLILETLVDLSGSGAAFFTDDLLR